MARADKLIAKLEQLSITMPFAEVKRVLEELGYIHIRKSGSHNVFRNEEGGILTIPTFHGREVKRVYLRHIAKLLEDRA